jgi:hypothetical protein
MRELYLAAVKSVQGKLTDVATIAATMTERRKAGLRIANRSARTGANK